MIDSNGLVIFEQIRELKRQGLALPDIKTALETAIETGSLSIPGHGETELDKPGKQDSQVLKELLNTQARLTDEMTARLEDTRQHARELQEKDKEISDLHRKVDTLDMALRMLPDGKTPRTDPQRI